VGRLGNGANTVHIYDQRGEREISHGALKSTSLKWARNLNVISEASASIPTGQHADCCDIMGSLGTWGHSLVFKRDGVRCWEGPLTNIRWRRGSVELSAHDVLGWSLVNTTDAARATTAPGFRAVDELYDDVGRVFADNDPNVLAHRQRIGGGTGPLTTREVAAYGGDFADQFNEMVKAGANFTTVGRAIVLWPSTSTIGRLPTLYPTRYMSGDVEVEERGLDLAARVIAANDKGVTGVAAGSVTVHPFYGVVEKVVSSSAADAAALAIVAEQYREQHFPAPVFINVPQGSVLSCDAPYDIRELVAGAMVDVKIDEGLCRLVEATQQLQSVEVTQDKDGEKVAVTVAPVSGVVT
jgi:hypothetical protein